MVTVGAPGSPPTAGLNVGAPGSPPGAGLAAGRGPLAVGRRAVVETSPRESVAAEGGR